MKRHYRIIVITQVYNELEKGNLKRFFAYLKPLVDEVVIYDDGSTDGSYEYAKKQTPHVLRGIRNNFTQEISHKKLLLKKALELKPDFILWLDADEVLSRSAEKNLQNLCAQAEKKDLDAISFPQINLWRSVSYKRTDSLFNIGHFVRLWRVKKGLLYKETKNKLHQQQHPHSIKKIEKNNTISVLHFGFASDLTLSYKYLTYRKAGQRGYVMLDRLINEEALQLKKVSPKIFPYGLYKNDLKPVKRSFAEALEITHSYKSRVYRPKYSIVCLIYKSVEWLEFVRRQVYRYTDMRDVEFFFVANDAEPHVLKHLKNNYIPHYIFNNSAEHKKEWYINNVYRAWNYGAQQARGDYIIFINSDMGFSPHWLENLLKYHDGSNCITSRLVESGKMKSGKYGIEKNFGRDIKKYHEEKFISFAKDISKNEAQPNGLFMPLLIRREHFLKVGGYPEGNVVPKSDIWKPLIAHKGHACISGDVILMEKLKQKGILHLTSFDSVVYHFQEGEMDSKKTIKNIKDTPTIAVVNDTMLGVMGERVLWNDLVDRLPGVYGVDKKIIGHDKDFEKHAYDFIKNKHASTRFVIQNASFIKKISDEHYTVSFLQDNLRAMNKHSAVQEHNLKKSNTLVTNSHATATAYPEFDFDVIPIGVDERLFYPKKAQQSLRKKYGLPHKKTGIFVGSLSPVKGWSSVVAAISAYPRMHFIIVTKDDNEYISHNTTLFRRVSQHTLSDLYNCADFFILGSAVETQCLSALEAGLCGIPVVMNNTGVFKQFSPQEKSNLGIFTTDLKEGIKECIKKRFSPRKTLIEKGFTTDSSVASWQRLLEQIHEKLYIQSLQTKKNTTMSLLQKIKKLFHV